MLETCADKGVVSEDDVRRLRLTQVTKIMTMQQHLLANFVVKSIHSPYSVEVEQALVAKLWYGEKDIPPSKRDLSKFDDADVGVGMILSVAHTNTWSEVHASAAQKRLPPQLKQSGVTRSSAENAILLQLPSISFQPMIPY